MIGLEVGPPSRRDVAAMAALLAAARKDCLPIGLAELRARLAEFEVARAPGGGLVGCAAVRWRSGRAELRALVVHPAWRRAGVGRLLVERAVRRTFAAGADLFCVSRSPGFFEALGFSRLPPEAVPERPGAARDRCALIRRREALTLEVVA